MLNETIFKSIKNNHINRVLVSLIQNIKVLYLAEHKRSSLCFKVYEIFFVNFVHNDLEEKIILLDT